MGRNILILLSFVFLYSACGQNAAETKQTNINRAQNAATTPMVSPSVSPTSVPTTATPDKSKARTFNGKGVVTKINLELVSVEVDHEEIKGLMPPMRMEFYVTEKRELEALKLGDKVDFVLEDNAGQEKIISIKKEK